MEGRLVDKVSNIAKTSNIDDLVFYIDYVEMILELVKKRGMEDPELELEHAILTKRYNELKSK